MSRSVYLDHAATTPMRPDAIEAMAATMAQTGNAASLHGAGVMLAGGWRNRVSR